MEIEYVHIKDFCSSHNIEEAFIFGLQEYELTEQKVIDDYQFTYIEKLPKVEKMVRLHQDLKINIDGIEAIHYLLGRTRQMSEELQTFRKRFRRHEEP